MLYNINTTNHYTKKEKNFTHTHTHKKKGTYKSTQLRTMETILFVCIYFSSSNLATNPKPVTNSRHTSVLNSSGLKPTHDVN